MVGFPKSGHNFPMLFGSEISEGMQGVPCMIAKDYIIIACIAHNG